MVNKLLPTEFAPVELASEKALKQQSDIIADQALLVGVLNGVSTAVVILNPERQIVFGNKAMLDFLSKNDLNDITGKRVGDVFGCVHARESDSGCGTTLFCRMCGAVHAILSSQKGNTDVQECRITLEEKRGALDLRIMAAPLVVNGEEFSIISVQDIADEKRKEALERIFFHDLMNTASGLQGFSRLLSSASEEALSSYSSTITNLADRLVDEIEAQRQISQAENERLKIQSGSSNTIDVLNKVREGYLEHEVARERHIEVDDGAIGLDFFTDETLLIRVLGNMIKNALEAIKPGEAVSLSCRQVGDNIRFSVWNPGEIPTEVRLQIFQRSFSTKALGRGLGTYSIKLLSENYLKGKVGFTTSAADGTLFYGDYPADLKAD
jgi:signal transduction histidine kinase